jgi:hypothetical protein
MLHFQCKVETIVNPTQMDTSLSQTLRSSARLRMSTTSTVSRALPGLEQEKEAEVCDRVSDSLACYQKNKTLDGTRCRVHLLYQVGPKER